MTRAFWPLALLLTVAAAAASLVLYPQLPDQIPTHFNLYGEPDAYGNKTWAAFMLPGVMVVVLILTRLLPWLSPRRFEVDTSRATYLFVMLLLIAFLAYGHALTLWTALGGHPDMGRALLAGLFLFFALIGNVLGKVRRNFWMGVRSPWTLASERVWIDTHRFAARLFVAVGILGFLMTLLGVPLEFMFAFLILGALAPVVYSLIWYKRLERRGEL